MLDSMLAECDYLDDKTTSQLAEFIAECEQWQPSGAELSDIIGFLERWKATREGLAATALRFYEGELEANMSPEEPEASLETRRKATEWMLHQLELIASGSVFLGIAPWSRSKPTALLSVWFVPHWMDIRQRLAANLVYFHELKIKFETENGTADPRTAAGKWLVEHVKKIASGLHSNPDEYEV